MSQPITNRSLRKVKAILWEPTKTANEFYSRPSEPRTPEVQRMLRVFLYSPWNHYDYIRTLDQVMLARHKISYFKLVNIQELQSFDLLKQPRLLSCIQHANVASIHDIYSHNDNIFLVTEHLDISITQLEPQVYELEEWEIATIITEVPDIRTSKAVRSLQWQVLNGITYLSSLKFSCKNFSKQNIRLSLDGDIKLGRPFFPPLILFWLIPLLSFRS